MSVQCVGPPGRCWAFVTLSVPTVRDANSTRCEHGSTSQSLAHALGSMRPGHYACGRWMLIGRRPRRASASSCVAPQTASHMHISRTAFSVLLFLGLGARFSLCTFAALFARAGLLDRGSPKCNGGHPRIPTLTREGQNRWLLVTAQQLWTIPRRLHNSPVTMITLRHVRGADTSRRSKYSGQARPSAS